jgi:hypothetical protein
VGLYRIDASFYFAASWWIPIFMSNCKIKVGYANRSKFSFAVYSLTTLKF